MNNYASRCVLVAGLCLGFVLAFTVTGRGGIAFFFGLIGAAATLSAVRDLIAYRKDRS